MDKPLKTFKQRIRQFTRRSGGQNLPEIAEQLRTYMPVRYPDRPPSRFLSF